MQVITDACVKIAVLEIFSKKKTREPVVRTFKNICTVAVRCWYIKDVFARLCQQLSRKKSFGWQKTFVTLNIFWQLRGWGKGLGESAKKKIFLQKSFPDNVEWSSKKL